VYTLYYCFTAALLSEQVRAIKDMASYVAQIKRLGTGHGVWDLDKKLDEVAMAAA
jgi:hypothetical protein